MGWIDDGVGAGRSAVDAMRDAMLEERLTRRGARRARWVMPPPWSVAPALSALVGGCSGGWLPVCGDCGWGGSLGLTWQRMGWNGWNAPRVGRWILPSLIHPTADDARWDGGQQDQTKASPKRHNPRSVCESIQSPGGRRLVVSLGNARTHRMHPSNLVSRNRRFRAGRPGTTAMGRGRGIQDRMGRRSMAQGRKKKNNSRLHICLSVFLSSIDAAADGRGRVIYIAFLPQSLPRPPPPLPSADEDDTVLRRRADRRPV